jgi:hypothetical protein
MYHRHKLLDPIHWIHSFTINYSMFINLNMERIYVSVKKNLNCCLNVNNRFALVNSEQRQERNGRETGVARQHWLSQLRKVLLRASATARAAGRWVSRETSGAQSNVTMAQENYSLYNV